MKFRSYYSFILFIVIIFCAISWKHVQADAINAAEARISVNRRMLDDTKVFYEIFRKPENIRIANTLLNQYKNNFAEWCYFIRTESVPNGIDGPHPVLYRFLQEGQYAPIKMNALKCSTTSKTPNNINIRTYIIPFEKGAFQLQPANKTRTKNLKEESLLVVAFVPLKSIEIKPGTKGIVSPSVKDQNIISALTKQTYDALMGRVPREYKHVSPQSSEVFDGTSSSSFSIPSPKKLRFLDSIFKKLSSFFSNILRLIKITS